MLQWIISLYLIHVLTPRCVCVCVYVCVVFVSDTLDEVRTDNRFCDCREMRFLWLNFESTSPVQYSSPVNRDT